MEKLVQVNKPTSETSWQMHFKCPLKKKLFFKSALSWKFEKIRLKEKEICTTEEMKHKIWFHKQKIEKY